MENIRNSKGVAMELEELFFKSCQMLEIEITEQQYLQFLEYKKLLLEWNQKINLTAITQEKEIIQRHFIDSIAILNKLQLPSNAAIIDVGTGAGFPGIPIKIVMPQIQLTLLDSLQKRIAFLEEVTNTLALESVSCIHARAEDVGKNSKFREQFEYGVSRAVAALPILCEYCLPLIQVGGYFAALKGPEVTQELKDAEQAIPILGGELSKVEQIKIPFTDWSHTLVIIKKVGQTPPQYPRKAGKALKTPIIS